MFHVQVTTGPCVFFVTALSARHHGNGMLREMTELLVAAEEERMVEDASSSLQRKTHREKSTVAWAR